MERCGQHNREGGAGEGSSQGATRKAGALTPIIDRLLALGNRLPDGPAALRVGRICNYVVSRPCLAGDRRFRLTLGHQSLRRSDGFRWRSSLVVRPER